jgi:hypothetical protein
MIRKCHLFRLPTETNGKKDYEAFEDLQDEATV